MNDASDRVSQARPACPPDRLLIGYEHVRCNTNTDVILPIGVFDWTSVDAINAFEPTAIQLAEKHTPTCPICGTAMNFAVWGPHNDEVEGRWPLASISAPTTVARSWRTSGVAWFWSTDREDFGNVVFENGQYVATTVRGSARFESLDDAKDFVEERSS